MCELLDDKLAYLLRRLVEQQWSHRLAHLQVLVQHFGRSLQIYHLALAVHVVDIVEEAWSAASARNHYILKLSHFVQQVVLDAAESVFALLVELSAGPESQKPETVVCAPFSSRRQQGSAKGKSGISQKHFVPDRQEIQQRLSPTRIEVI